MPTQPEKIDVCAQMLDESDATILCVDDAADVLMTLAWFLRNEGFQVDTAASADAALKSTQSHLPDLIVTDYSMPGMSGLELCRHLRASPETQDIPIILHTGHSVVPDAALFECVIAKPAALQAVASQIRTLLHI